MPEDGLEMRKAVSAGVLGMVGWLEKAAHSPVNSPHGKVEHAICEERWPEHDFPALEAGFGEKPPMPPRFLTHV